MDGRRMLRVHVLLSDGGVGTFERLLRANMTGYVRIGFVACKCEAWTV